MTEYIFPVAIGDTVKARVEDGDEVDEVSYLVHGVAQIGNKQIEEMANDLAKICPDLVENCCGQINCVTHLTLSLSKIGYRKASDVAREIFEEIERILSLNKCYEDSGIYFERDIETDIAELKKKYTEDGK